MSVANTCASRHHLRPPPNNTFLQHPKYVPIWFMENESHEPDQPDQLPAPPTAEPDAHGHDASDYHWVPVLRRQRKDGWSPQRQRDFIVALADTGCVAIAARTVEMSVMSCYRLRRSPDAGNFAAAWDAALEQAARMLIDVAFDRALNGTDVPIFDRHGQRLGTRHRPNDRMLIFLLRSYMPERFGEGHHAGPPARSSYRGTTGGDAGDAPPAIDQALRALHPVTPLAPHLTMSPEDLDEALHCAHILPGKLPYWHDYRATGGVSRELGEERDILAEEADAAARSAETDRLLRDRKEAEATGERAEATGEPNKNVPPPRAL